MQRGRLLPLLGLALIPSQCCSPGVIDLDATPWEFAADPADVGVAERWYDSSARPRLERTVTTPGAWEAQGVGNATALMTHQLQGVGWYRKTLSLRGYTPAAGQSLWLWLGGAPGGVMRSANVYAAGVHIGRHVGYLEPLEMELTDAVGNSSSVTLALAVDSRWNRTEDPLWGSGSLWNYGGVGTGGGGGDGYSFGGYGGIVGHARLLLRERSWIEDSVLVSCVASDRAAGDWTCRVQFSLAGNASGSDQATISICSWNSPEAPCVNTTSKAGGPAGERTEVSITIPDAKLWVPGTRQPQANLYIANIVINDELGRALDSRETRFGVRSVKAEGPRIEFNGEAVFLRGYGDDGNYATTAAPPMDKAFYVRQLRSMQALGYNFIRFHTHSMPTELLDVADELGFLCDPEFAMSCEYLPCPCLSTSVLVMFGLTGVITGRCVSNKVG